MSTSTKRGPETEERIASSVIAKRPRMALETAEEEISRGAEGVVSRISYLGRFAVRKKRFAKRYRHPELDSKLTSRRLSQEARVMLRLRKAGIRVPAVYFVDVKNGVIVMEHLHGITLKEFLRRGNAEDGKAVMQAAGKEVARMHCSDVVHGDLTTGNIMVASGASENVSELNGIEVCVIDFGLSSGGSTEEDFAVDLYVFERAVISAHSEAAQPLNEAFLSAYAQELKRPAVLKRLEEVRARGRKRDMTG